MQLPIIAHRGQTKPYPSIPRINWNHPLAAGLINYGYDVGCGPLDLVRGGQRTINNTGTPFGGFKTSKYGAGLNCASGGATTNSLCLLPGNTDISNIAVAAPYSYAGGLMLTAAPTAFARLFSWCDSTTGIPAMLATDSAGPTDYSFRFAATDANTAAGVVKLNQFQTLVGVALTGAAARSYVDGVLVDSPSLTTTQAATADCRPAFFGLRSGAGASLPPGFIYYTALWKGRALTASEVRLLHDDPYCFLIYPEDEMFASNAIRRYLRPDADSIDGSWTNELGGTSLFDSIDETVVKDSDYIRSSVNPSSDVAKISLSNPSGSVADPVVLRYRYRKTSAQTANLTVRLLQGSTEIAAFTHTAISSEFVTAAQTLTAPQLASITDFNDLYIELTAS